MVKENTKRCPVCKSTLRFFDRTKRMVRTKGRRTFWVNINRVKCTKCNKVHRVLPPFILPYKEYEAELIRGVIEGLITSETLGYEDYPCEATMKSWRRSL